MYPKVKKDACGHNRTTKGIISVLLFVIISTFAISNVAEAKPKLTGTHNYLGTDGKWHYVKTYKDTQSGSEWSEAWENGEGPIVYHPKTLPNFGIIAGGGDGNSPFEILEPIELPFEFTASTSGTIEFKVEEDVDIEITKLDDGSVFLQKTHIYGRPSFQQIEVPSGFYTYRPYGIVVYKNQAPMYMELFFFDGSAHNSMEQIYPSHDE
jgi:hypothetical protein